MITTEQWLNTFTAYNTNYLPVLGLTWLVLIVALIMYFYQTRQKNRHLSKSIPRLCILLERGRVFLFLHEKQPAPRGNPDVPGFHLIHHRYLQE